MERRIERGDSSRCFVFLWKDKKEINWMFFDFCCEIEHKTPEKGKKKKGRFSQFFGWGSLGGSNLLKAPIEDFRFFH